MSRRTEKQSILEPLILDFFSLSSLLLFFPGVSIIFFPFHPLFLIYFFLLYFFLLLRTPSCSSCTKVPLPLTVSFQKWIIEQLMLALKMSERPN